MGKTLLQRHVRTANSLFFVLAMSTLCMISLCMIGPKTANAHEVTPTIADLEITDGVLTLDLRLNIEAFVAGIDLDDTGDTDESALSPEYDTLRGMDAATLGPRVQDFAANWVSQIQIMADGGAVKLSVADLVIPPVGDASLPRASTLSLTGTVPSGARDVTVSWPKGAGNMVLRQQGVAEPFTDYIKGGTTSPPIPIAGGTVKSGWQVFAGYIPVGFDHIIPKGLDHILFVLGLFFLSTGLRPLFWQISAFTLAHTITLGLGAVDVISVPASIVEPLIAASIVYVAVENIFTDHLNKWRPLVIFCFGLLHGLGFASVLGDFGLPAGQFLPALFGFNIGVEVGQITVIAVAFLTVGFWFGDKPWYRARIAVPASVAIAIVGSFWFVERII